jgi:periplasmic divalent cation tolerance protein
MSPYPMDPVDATGPMRLVLSAFPATPASAAIVREAVDRRLAACASQTRVRSEYRWKGAIETADEQLVLFKTVPKRVGALFAFLRARHPYEVPEILEIDVARVDGPYLRYLAATLDPNAPPPPLGGGAPGPARSTRRGGRRARAAPRPARTRGPRRRR